MLIDTSRQKPIGWLYEWREYHEPFMPPEPMCDVILGEQKPVMTYGNGRLTPLYAGESC